MIRVHVAYHHPVVRETLASLLADIVGVKVVGRRSGADGVDEVSRSRPHVVLLSEPGLDTATNLIARYRTAAPGIKIVLLGGGSGESGDLSGADVEVDVAEGVPAIVQAIRAVAR
jgi:DNA-binding NarL/FixJ family response regulator